MTSNQYNLFLTKLTIQDFATFKSQIINFDTGLNVIIGETGAGKSLVLDALQLILGSRADKKLIRKGADFAIIEATFQCTDHKVKQYLGEQGFPFEDEVIIKRVLYKEGHSKAYLNHLTCSIGVLTGFARTFVDLVGQFENQKLLSSIYQLHLLDRFANITHKVESYALQYQQWKDKLSMKEKLLSTKEESDRRLDYLLYQVDQIEKLDPSVEDEKNLLTKKDALMDSEENKKNLEIINQIYEGTDLNLGLGQGLQKVQLLLPDNSELESRVIELKEELEDIHFNLNKLYDHEFTQDELDEVVTKLDQYQKLKSKFNTDTEGLIKIHKDYTEEINNLKEQIYSVEKIDLEISEFEVELKSQALKIHKERQKFSDKFTDELTKEVRTLNMSGATIQAQVSQSPELGPYGISSLEFLAETNRGEGFFPIKKIASGGELSRILLALRKLIASKDSISIFLFDEIDTGIGGETALSVGRTLQDVSSTSQVITITHLPQIANFAKKLIVVSKVYQDTRTESEVREVVSQNILDEVKQMAPLN